ncbi:MAG: divalent-cation tolerance protein CutA [Acidobacteria bacterium]|nr:divalent-cation tolerance protein CutA [Acidobacteriota bacterium]
MHLLVFSTVSSQEEGERIGQELVRARLAACVNVVPRITSIYEWKGELCRETECLLLIKSHRGRFQDLQEKIRQLHSYELPEVIGVEICEGSERYLAWIDEVMRTPG